MILRIFEDFSKPFVDLKDMLIFLISFKDMYIEEKIACKIF